VQPSFNPNDFNAKMEQLKRASTDSALGDNDVNAGLTDYLKYRDAALAEAQRRGFPSLRSDKVADLRAWLVSKAAQIQGKHPNFGRLYDRVLSSEVEDNA
jgi:hypothetical protein